LNDFSDENRLQSIDLKRFRSADSELLMTLTTILVAARWGHFAAVFVLFGCPLSFLLARGAAPAATERLFNAANRLLQIAAVTAALSGLVWIAALIVNIAGSFADAATLDTLEAFFFETQFGPIVIARLILLAAGVLALALPRRLRFGVWLGVGAGLLVDQAWLGHAANGGASLFGAVAILLYAIHVLSGAAWVGGLPILLLALAQRAPAKTPREIVTLLSRYSELATGAVTLIIASGGANALLRVQGHFMRFLGTSYGEILLVKLVLVALMLGLASYNRFIAMPRLAKAEPRPEFASLSRSIGVELALGLLVIGAAALLGITPPPA
jgi:copper resistance protein D